MMSPENIALALKPQRLSQSATHQKKNTKLLNANTILQCVSYLLKMLGLH